MSKFDFSRIAKENVLATIDNTVLSQGNKIGRLSRDDNGYAHVYLSAWEFPNSQGAIYDITEELKQLHAPGSQMHTLAETGRLRGEIDHPYPQPGQKFIEYLNRLMYIHDQFVSFAIKQPRLVEVQDEYGKRMTVTEAWVTGSGGYMEQFNKRMDNPDENLDFSLRSICYPSRMMNDGVVHKKVRAIATWDQVNRGGISIANKYDAPSLESDGPVFAEAEWFDASKNDQEFVLDDVSIKALEALNKERNMLGMESADTSLFDSRMFRDPKGDWKRIEVLHKTTSLGWAPIK